MDISICRFQHRGGAILPGCVGYRSEMEKVSSVQRLVKAYQEEIDALVKRCRASDSAFFSLYKSFYEAPDPAKALERLASDRPRAAASEVREGSRRG